MSKVDIDIFPEFCYEVFSAAPYALWLKEQGKLGKITTCKGMKPFYYFCDDVEEKYDIRSLDNHNNGVQNLPNPWIHHNPKISNNKNGVQDYSQWVRPPYEEYYKNDEFVYDKPYIVVYNQFGKDEMLKPLTRYFDLECLYNVFNILNEKGYKVIYIRPGETDFTLDQNDFNRNNISAFGNGIYSDVEGIGKINDHELTDYYDDVHSFNNLLEQHDYTFNELQLRLLANAKSYVTISGGSAILQLMFQKPSVIYATCNRELLPEYWDEESYYQVISNNNAIPVIDKNVDIYERGYQDYSELYKKVEENFNEVK